MQLKDNLKKFRDQKALTQDELATRVHLQGGAQIAQYEAGTKTPSLEKALAMAHELGVSLSQLVGEHPPPGSVPGQVTNHIHGDNQTVYQYVERACLWGEEATALLRQLLREQVEAHLEAVRQAPQAGGGGEGPASG